MQHLLQHIRLNDAALVGGEVELVPPHLLRMSQGDLDDEALPGLEQPALLEGQKQLTALLLGDGVSDDRVDVAEAILGGLEGDAQDADVAVPAPLALDQKTALRREAAAEDVVDLARHTAERLGQLLALEGDDGFVPLGAEEIVDVFFDGSGQIGQIALPAFEKIGQTAKLFAVFAT